MTAITGSEGLMRAARQKVAAGERAGATALAVLLLLGGVLITPVAARAAFEIPEFLTACGSVTLVIDLVVAVLLFSMDINESQPAPVRLATAYLFAALILLAQVAAFPGPASPLPALGNPVTNFWLWSFWHVGFPLAIARHALLVRPAERLAVGPAISGPSSAARPSAVLRAVIATTLLVLALVAVAVLGAGRLASSIGNATWFPDGLASPVPWLIFASNLAALLLVVVRFRCRSAPELWLSVAMLAGCVDVWLTIEAGTRYSVGWYAGRGAGLIASLVVLVSVLRDAVKVHSSLAAARQAIDGLVRLDGLTGLANRRHFDETLGVEVRRARRDSRPLSVVLLDVDVFRSFGGAYGHAAGEECLRAIGYAVRAVARRPGDLAARTGGETFALVLPATDIGGAMLLANEIRAAVRRQATAHRSSPKGLVTISAGVASATSWPGEDAETLVAQAYAALARAKEDGGDQARSAPPRLASVRQVDPADAATAAPAGVHRSTA